MKYFLTILLSSIISWSALSQVKITIKNADQNLLYAAPYAEPNKKTIAKPKEGKDDILTLQDVKTETLITIGCNKQVCFIWAKDGDELEIDAETGLVQGGNEKINSYLHRWKNEFIWNKNSIIQNQLIQNNLRRDYVEYTTSDFLQDDYLAKLKQDKQKQLQQLQQEINDPAFTSYFQQIIESNYTYTLIRTPLVIENQGDVEIPKAILEAIIAIDLDQVNFISESYKNSILYSYAYAHEKLKLVKPSMTDFIYQKGKLFKNKELQEYYVLYQLDRLVKKKETLFTKELFDSAKKLITSAEGKKEYDRLYASRASDSEINKKAAPLKVYGIDDQEITLEQFKGKYVYIDFWATWCTPCKQMTPHFVEMAEKYKDDNIVFLSISVDNQNAKQKWLKYTQEHLAQSHCISARTVVGFQHSFVQHYKITAIPRFMLIKPDGTIYSDKFCRPNDPRLELIFKEILR